MIIWADYSDGNGIGKISEHISRGQDVEISIECPFGRKKIIEIHSQVGRKKRNPEHREKREYHNQQNQTKNNIPQYSHDTVLLLKSEN